MMPRANFRRHQHPLPVQPAVPSYIFIHFHFQFAQENNTYNQHFSANKTKKNIIIMMFHFVVMLVQGKRGRTLI